MALAAFTNTFAGNPLDRASDKRSDARWLEARIADPQSLGVVLWRGAPLVERLEAAAGEPSAQLAYLPLAALTGVAEAVEPPLFLGLWKDAGVFGLELEGAADPTLGPLKGLGAFEDLRGLALRLTAAEAAIAATAKAVFEWRRRHRFCAACGQPTHAEEGGWKRVCPACSTQHFPRTDPVVIMLPTCGERCLLGRQAAWPAGMWSALAGFLEPGEAIEEACARELREEADLKALRVVYHSSQPWPFPSSLMIGLLAEVADEPAVADQAELEAVRWFDRQEAQRLLRGEIEGVFAPPRLAIAHQLIRAWAFA
jgi:NAD+ diphosphatase